jgi:soluble lytic murein transglycosylase-like protein
MINLELEQLARTLAAKFDVPADVLCGMIEREDQGNPWAVRYEPGFLARYVMPQYKAGKLDITETYCRAMSWGLLQIMGETARELGFEGKYLSELCDPPVGIKFGCLKLAACLKRTKGDINAALEQFNGGDNLNYAAEVLSLSMSYRVLDGKETG